jgi:hypothetical protein
MDTSFRMLDDGAGNYYDVKTYKRTDDTQVANALGVPSGNSSYRRIYQGTAVRTGDDPQHQVPDTATSSRCGTPRRPTPGSGRRRAGKRRRTACIRP